MSPYLFVMCMERLSVMIQSLVDKGEWKPIRISKNGPPISHLFFADDVLLFCEASVSQVQLLASTMQRFCDSSGLKINLNKSKAIVSKGVSAMVKDSIAGIAPIPFVNDLGKYLGFPLRGGRVQRSRFNFLLESIQRKLNSWRANMLNLAGRVCLAKSVIAAIPTYTMQVFNMPRGITARINQIMRSFIWSGKGGGKGWHLVSWKKLTKPKEYGGLGVHDMDLANTALLGKAVWSLLQNTVKNKYDNGVKVINAHVRLLGACFKTRRMGSQYAYGRSMQVSKHAEAARAVIHNHDNDVSTSILTAWALTTTKIRIGQYLKLIDGPTCIVPHLTETHR